MNYWTPEDVEKEAGKPGNGNKAVIWLALAVIGTSGVTGINQWQLRDQQKRVLDKVDQIPYLIERMNAYQKALEEERQDRKDADREKEQRLRIIENRVNIRQP